MVDMSATIIHHGHIRLLKKAKEHGKVIVGLTSDNEIKNKKGYVPELAFEHRKEVLEAIKYVDEVVEVPWLLDDKVLDKYEIDLLVHGDDNSNHIKKEKLLIFPRTKGVCSSDIRQKSSEIFIKKQDNIYDNWNIKKKQLENASKLKTFKERDILLMSVGQNIGYEQFGKGEEFLRPVLVYKKFNAQTFLAIPLTSKQKDKKYYFSFTFIENKISTANFSQIKTMDIKRVKYKMGKMYYKDFNMLENKLKAFLGFTSSN
jgi:glycerol-3-phosphate cytidylyltransferase